MTLRFSSSDNYTSSHDNLSWTISQFVDSRENTKSTLSADNFSLYNKVTGQSLTRLTVEQAQTARQCKFLHNFSSGFLISPEICTLPCSCLRAAKSKNGRSKTPAKKLSTFCSTLSDSFAVNKYIFETTNN